MIALLWFALAFAQHHDPEPEPAPVQAEPVEETIEFTITDEPEVVEEPEPVPPPEPEVVVVYDHILEYGPIQPPPEPEPIEFVGPMPQPEPVVVLPPTPPPVHTPWVGDVLPWVAFRGFWPGVFLLFVATLFASLSVVLGRMQARLHTSGLLPQFSQVGAAASRVLAAFFALGAVGAWVPANLAPAVPWLIVGVALAVGWSARDLLPDLMAFAVMRLEGRVREGRWVQGEGFKGEVKWVGPRATVVLDERGGEVMLPNRVLIRAPFARDPSEWPLVDVTVQLAPTLDADRARRALREAVLLSPWVAPGDLEIHADTDGSGAWSVSVRLLEGTYLAQFEGSLRERVAEVLGP